jgi:hypothetical protein
VYLSTAQTKLNKLEKTVQGKKNQWCIRNLVKITTEEKMKKMEEQQPNSSSNSHREK